MKRSPSPVADRSPEWPCLPKGQDLAPKTYRRPEFRPVPTGLGSLLHSLREFEPTSPRPRDHIGLADSIADADPFTVLLFTEPLAQGHWGRKRYMAMRRAKTFARGCGTGSGSRESHSYFALAFLELQRRGLHIPSYVLVYDRDNRLRFVDAWGVPLVLPYDIGCNCAVDRDVVRGLVAGAWKAAAERRRDWTGFVRINVWKDRDPAEGPHRIPQARPMPTIYLTTVRSARPSDRHYTAIFCNGLNAVS